MEDTLLKEVSEAVIAGDEEKVEELVRRAVSEGMDPMHAIENGLGRGIRTVGDRYGAGDCFLPDLMMSAKAMQSGLRILEAEIKRLGGKKSLTGKFVLGTVAGDIHDIGKTIVGSLLFAEGFEVTDLGVDVQAEKFIEAVRDVKPRFLGLSALLSTTREEQKAVIELLEKKGLRGQVRVVVGGAATSDAWAREIGADAYSVDAVSGVAKIKKMI